MEEKEAHEEYNSLTKSLKKRRTREEIGAIKYTCKYCPKAYYSFPALYTHCKLKHNSSTATDRPRGRPKGNKAVEEENESENKDKIKVDFFDDEVKKGRTSEDEIADIVLNIFNEIFGCNNKLRNQVRSISYYDKLEDNKFLHNLYEEVKKLKENPQYDKSNLNKSNGGNSSVNVSFSALKNFSFANEEKDKNEAGEYDENLLNNILVKYVMEMKDKLNATFFSKLTKFITIFKEFLLIKQKESSKEDNFSLKLDLIPELSNDFIIEFLAPDIKCYSYGFSMEESTNFCKNLCDWLFKNKHTKCKIVYFKEQSKKKEEKNKETEGNISKKEVT